MSVKLPCWRHSFRACRSDLLGLYSKFMDLDLDCFGAKLFTEALEAALACESALQLEVTLEIDDLLDLEQSERSMRSGQSLSGLFEVEHGVVGPARSMKSTSRSIELSLD